MATVTHALIGAAAKIPNGTTTPILAFSPVVLPINDRRVDLQLRVTFPSEGTSLPVVILSHGHGRSNYLSSSSGYAPVAEHWAAHGFAVIQPTHTSSRTLGIPLDDDNILDIFLESRVKDISRVIDHFDAIEAAVPLLKGRLDRDRIAVAGHSLGGLTASAALGATNTDPRTGAKFSAPDSRLKAGVVFGGTGRGGDAMSEGGTRMLPFYNGEFSAMRTPTLVVWGELDDSRHLSESGPTWHKDPYELAPGPKAAFKVTEGKHGFGGISGWDAKETQDESPERLGAVLRMTTAYLKTQLNGGTEWKEACDALKGLPELGEIEEKE